MVKKVLKAVAILALLIFLIFLRVFIHQYKEFKKGEAAFSSKDYKEASTHYETALHMYTPLSPYIEQSKNRMLEIAKIYEQNNEYRWALITYEDLRSSLYSVKSFYLPYPEVVALCDSKIAELIKKVEQ